MRENKPLSNVCYYSKQTEDWNKKKIMLLGMPFRMLMMIMMMVMVMVMMTMMVMMMMIVMMMMMMVMMMA